MNAEKTLVVVPCGIGKIWDREPGRGPTPAKDAYSGAPFKVNREYAEERGDHWVILSAKYGFIPPHFLIPEPYNVTFKRPSPEVITLQRLREQAEEQGLTQYGHIVGLGGREYRTIVERVFEAASDRLSFPFAGLPIGKAMQATKRSLAGEPPLPPSPQGEANQSPENIDTRRGVPQGYQGLTTWLREVADGVLTVSFGELEQRMGRPLPPSARKHAAWWANATDGSHGHARAWLGTGWRVKADIRREEATFTRV